MKSLLLLVLVSILTGCVGARTPVTEIPAAPEDVVWRGLVTVANDVVLPRGARLVLEPGTVVRFAFRDDDGDGWGDTSLVIQGALVARGTADRPVVFTSASEPAEPGQWGEVRIDYGTFDLSYAVIEGSTRGLHAHFCRGAIADSILRRNVDGTRLGETSLTVERSVFADHVGKGYNARRCRAKVSRCLFRQNRNGIFLFEADDDSVFEENAFRGNQTAFRLGDFFEGTARAPRNDWGGPTPDPTGPDSAGRLEASAQTVPAAGPLGWPLWREAWTAGDSSYVDASPTLTDEGLYTAAWSGEVQRLGLLDGTVLARTHLPDAVDSALAVGPGVVAANCWDRGLHLLRRNDLRALDSFQEARSPADDHRQSGPIFKQSTLFAATWAGFVRAFSTAESRLDQRWAFEAAGPFRADLSTTEDTVLAPCQDGSLYALGAERGTLRWRFDSGAPLLSGAAVDDRRAYLASKDGVLHAVDLASGTESWRTTLGGPVWYASPLLAGRMLYQGDDSGQLRAIDKETGAILWARHLGAGIRSRPALVAGESVAVGTAGGRLWLLDAETGSERDSVDLGGPVFSSPAVAGDRVFVGTRDGRIRALDVIGRVQ